MAAMDLEPLFSSVSATSVVSPVGRIERMAKNKIVVAGLSDFVSLGDVVMLRTTSGKTALSEVLTVNPTEVTVSPDSDVDGFKIGDRAVLKGPLQIFPCDGWLGRILDANGLALDGKPQVHGTTAMELRGEVLNSAKRRGFGDRLETGLVAFNTFLPIARGQRMGLFAGSGVGKSSLMGKLALGLEAEIIIVAMIGERGREVRDFVDKVLGPDGMQKTIVFAATSDQSPVLRRRCALSAMAAAEYFRDIGRQVMFFADSISRFAEAYREIACAAGEDTSMRGFPPSVTFEITSLCERAGPGLEGQGDITAIFNVLVAGSDMDEPVADIMRGVLDGHIVLSRDIAERGRYPAIDILRSVSRSLPGAANDLENALLTKARAHLSTYEKNEIMISAGLYPAGSDPKIDAAIQVWPDLDYLISQDEPGQSDVSFERIAAVLDKANPAENL